MADFAKIFNQQFLDESGTPYALATAEFWDSAGASRKAVWTDREKTQPSTAGTLADITADDEGRIVAYGDGVYQVILRTSGGVIINTFEGVQLVDTESSYTGDTSPFTLTDFEDRFRRGQYATNSVTGGGAIAAPDFDLSLFDGTERIYKVTGGSGSILAYTLITPPTLTEGQTIILVGDSGDPVKFVARDSDPVETHNLDFGEDVYLRNGDVLTLWWDGSYWHVVSYRHMADFDSVLEGAGVASASAITLTTDDAVVKITGTTNIDNIWFLAASTMAPPGRKLDLLFAGALTVKHNTGNIQLGADFETAANAVLQLVSDGSNWHRRDSRDVADATPDTLNASDATPTVTGATIWYTGGDNTTITRFDNPTHGKRITIIHNEATAPNDDYLNVRKEITHEDDTGTEGYISLRDDMPFYMLDGDTLDLICLTDASAVKYWREVSRHEDLDVAPEIDVTTGGTLVIWKPTHVLNNTTGDTVSITDIAAQPPGKIINFIYGGTNNVKFSTGGNLKVYSAGALSLSQPNELVTFLSTKSGSTSMDWTQVEHASTDL